MNSTISRQSIIFKPENTISEAMTVVGILLADND